VSGYRLLYPQFIDDRKVIIESLPQLSSRRGGDPPQSCCGLLPALGFVKKRVVVASALHRYFFPLGKACMFPYSLMAFLIPTTEAKSLVSAGQAYFADNEVFIFARSCEKN
jgi:hypothetical protein